MCVYINDCWHLDLFVYAYVCVGKYVGMLVGFYL